MFATALSCLYFSLPQCACWLVFLPYQPIDPLILLWDFLAHLLYSLPFIIFVDLLVIIPAMLAHLVYHFILWASPAHLLLLYFFFTPMSLLLYSLVFLGPFTTFLPLITFMGHVDPTEFTTLFLKFPQPVYFFFTSRYSHGLTVSFLGLPRPVYFCFTSCYFHELVGYQSCHISPLGLLPHSLLFAYFLLFSLIIGFLILLGHLSKIDINS